MFHAPISANKQPRDPTRTRPSPEKGREVHPYSGAAPSRTDKRVAILQLQRSIGNQAVRRLLEQQGRNPPAGQGAAGRSNPPPAQTHFAAPPGALQAKLVVGPADDPLEQEADRVAEQVMRMPDSEPTIIAAPPRISRKCAACEEEEAQKVQPKPAATAGTAAGDRVTEPVMRMPDDMLSTEGEADSESTLAVLKIICPDCEDEVVQAKEDSGELAEVNPGLESQIQSMKAGGEPLPESLRAFFEPRFGYDFSNVRIHTENAAAGSAKQLNALAYTVGTHIAFGSGQYKPHSFAGNRLLTHELTHVVQQGNQSRHARMNTTSLKRDGDDQSRTSYAMEAIGAGSTPIRISKQTSQNQIRLHTTADCDREYESCSDTCRSLPPGAKRRRALCWAACMAAYVACLASSEEVTFAALVALIVAAAASSPFALTAAGAAALLISLGITGSSGSSGPEA